MNQLFGSMTNTTAPGVFESQRRGVISGGSVVVRNRIMNENLVSMVPPSFQAGCGGIDMFAGSLSFVNADQFVQLLRSVAANAKGTHSNWRSVLCVRNAPSTWRHCKRKSSS